MLTWEKYALLALVVAVIGWWALKPADEAPVTATPAASAKAQPQQQSTEDMALMACIAAQKAVKARLKSPSTADFPDCGWSLRKYEIRANPEKTEFAVKGYVDSQNGFGAIIRSTFIVFLRKGAGTGSSAFTATDIAIE